MNSRSELSSCASRPIEAMVWINEIESAKSIAELKTSNTVTGAKWQMNFEFFFLKKIGDWPQEKSPTETLTEESLLKKKLHRKRNASSLEGRLGRSTNIARSAARSNLSWT